MGTDIVPANKTPAVELPISPQDIKYWECVQRVREQFSRGCNTTRKACELAGVSHDFYYVALKSPYVQSQIALELDAIDKATHEIVRRSWVPIMINMARIAESQDSKEAVQAARLVREVQQDLKKMAEELDRGSATHPAKLLAQSYLKPRAVRRTTVVEEVELE